MIPSRLSGPAPSAAHALTHSVRGTARTIALAAVAILAAVLAVMAVASPAHAASRVDVSPAPNAEGETVVTLSGSGFQYQPNAPGGVYVFFGSVQDPATNSWAPSQGGKSGSTFGYAGSTSLLVAFAGGSSAEAANATIDANGNWSAQMTIPGATFASSSGNPHEGAAVEGATIDCTRVQCGIITIGAHGMINANNESFTPVSFVTASGEVVSGTGGASFTDEATQLEIPGAGGGAEEGAEKTAGSGQETEGAGAGASQREDPDEAGEQTAVPAAADGGGLSSTALVLGVLGFALLVLIAAVVVAVARRSRAKRAALAAPAEPAEPGTPGDPARGPAGSPDPGPERGGSPDPGPERGGSPDPGPERGGTAHPTETPTVKEDAP